MNNRQLGLELGLLKSAFGKQLLALSRNKLRDIAGKEFVRSELGKQLFKSLKPGKLDPTVLQNAFGSAYYGLKGVPEIVEQAGREALTGLDKKLISKGALIGGGLGGGLGGGIAAYKTEDKNNKLKNALIGLVSGGAAGAGLGAGAGAGLSALNKFRLGVSGVAPRIAQNLAGIADMTEHGAFPGLLDPLGSMQYTDALRNAMDSAQKGGLSLSNTGQALKSIGDFWNTRNQIYTAFLTPNKNTGTLPINRLLGLAKNYGVDTLNVGEIINPNMVDYLNQPTIQKLLSESGFSRVLGNSAKGKIRSVTPAMQDQLKTVLEFFNEGVESQAPGRLSGIREAITKSTDPKTYAQNYDKLKNEFVEWLKRESDKQTGKALDPTSLFGADDYAAAKTSPGELQQLIDAEFNPAYKRMRAVWDTTSKNPLDRMSIPFDFSIPRNLARGERAYTLPVENLY